MGDPLLLSIIPYICYNLLTNGKETIIMDKLLNKSSKAALIIAGLTVIGVFPWNIYTISMLSLTAGFLIFRMILSISSYSGLWKELTTPRVVIDDLSKIVNEEHDNFWSDYKYRLKHLSEQGEGKMLYKIIYLPIFNRIIRRSYIIQGAIPKKMPNPLWMSLVTTKEETYIPFPQVIEAYKEMGYIVDMAFDQSDVKYYKVFKNEASVNYTHSSFPSSTEPNLFVKINGKWELVMSKGMDGLFNKLSEVGKMQLNIFNITCNI
jgi:hypothetical protein